jgi:hypothetical protein
MPAEFVQTWDGQPTPDSETPQILEPFSDMQGRAPSSRVNLREYPIQPFQIASRQTIRHDARSALDCQDQRPTAHQVGWVSRGKIDLNWSAARRSASRRWVWVRVAASSPIDLPRGD